MPDSLPPHGLQHARFPCPSPTPRVCSNSCPSSWRCHLTISSSLIPFSSCLQSFPASGSFPMNQFFTSGGQSIGASDSASVLPVNIQDWFPLGWTGWISLQSKGLSTVFSNTTVQIQWKVKVKSLSCVQLHGLQHARLPCLSPTPRACSNSYVYRVSDAIRSSHPLSSPSPPAFSLSQHQGLFQWVSSSHQIAKVWELQLQHQSFQWIFRTNCLYNGLVGSSCSPRDSQETSPTPQVKSINS